MTFIREALPSRTPPPASPALGALEHQDMVVNAVFSPDRTRVLTASATGVCGSLRFAGSHIRRYRPTPMF